jgi:membrane associated rhomboid family serine protease
VFLIPIGHDQQELRHLPVVTCAIIGLCILVHFCQPEVRPGHRRAVHREMKEALEYYRKNPDLAAAPALQQVFDETRTLVDTRHSSLDEESRPARQAHLDELTHGWLDSMRDDTPGRWGLIPAEFSWLKLLTSMFVHVGLFHLIFNMLFLYLTGPFVEDVWGRPAFLAFYLLGGGVAGLLFAMGARTLAVPMVGASGAVAAVMGAFLVRYPRASIQLLTFLLWRPVRFNGPAWAVISLWFVGEFAEAYDTPTLTPLGGGVANWAHVWGFLFGVSVAAVHRFYRPEEHAPAPATDTPPLAVERDPLLQRIEHLVGRGEEAVASQLLAARLHQNPHNAELASIYWELSRRGAMVAHPALSLRIIQSDLEDWRENIALERWQEFHAAVPAAVPDVHLCLLLARALARHQRGQEGDALLMECYRHMGPATPAEEWAAFAEYCLFCDIPIAADVVARALAHPGVPPGTRSSLQRQLRVKSGLTGTGKPGTAST